MVAGPARSSEPTHWSIEEMVQHIADTDPGLAVYADLFRKHVSTTVLSM